MLLLSRRCLLLFQTPRHRHSYGSDNRLVRDLGLIFRWSFSIVHMVHGPSISDREPRIAFPYVGSVPASASLSHSPLLSPSLGQCAATEVHSSTTERHPESISGPGRASRCCSEGRQGKATRDEATCPNLPSSSHDMHKSYLISPSRATPLVTPQFALRNPFR